MRVHELFEVVEPPLDPRYEMLANEIKSKYLRNFNLIASSKVIPLFRGSSEPMVILNNGLRYCSIAPRVQPRVSATGSNLVMGFVSQHPSWSKFPNRALSCSCTPDVNHSNNFKGRSGLIIPADDVDSYAITLKDFNYISVNGTEPMFFGEMIDDFRKCLSSLGNESRSGIDPQFSQLLKNPILKISSSQHPYSLADIKALSDVLSKAYDFLMKEKNFRSNGELVNAQESKEVYFDMLSDKGKMMTLWEYFEKFYTPDKMGVTLGQQLSDFNSIDTDSGAEIWFSGNYLVIKSMRIASIDLLESSQFKQIVDLVNR